MSVAPEIGFVETSRAVLFDRDDPLVLESGATLAPVEVAYETYGQLSGDRGNAVFVCHALTGDAHAAGHHGDPGVRGWWDNLIGPGRPLDTRRFFVISPNLLGGCRGTTGPASTDPRTGQAFGLRFPQFTVRDLTVVHRRLLAQLGIERLHAAIGGSLGGMQVLQWALDEPDRIARAALICASARLSAQNIAFSAVARAAILGDPAFAGGDYLGAGTRPDHGLAVARMIAHITYLSEESMRRKFDRRRRSEDAAMRMTEDFEVEHYLKHQGAAFIERFDPLSYLYLSRTMDYFEPFRGGEGGAGGAGGVSAAGGAGAPGGAGAARREGGTRFLLLSFSTDWRFGREHSAYIASELGRRGAAVERAVEIDSPWGHDSFLLDLPEYHRTLAEFLGDPVDS